ncbi:MAG: S41 family peptidase [Roseiflexaceae bacterium]|nr:S41 family peptidase [Roseiflexaceae bacterium]
MVSFAAAIGCFSLGRTRLPLLGTVLLLMGCGPAALPPASPTHTVLRIPTSTTSASPNPVATSVPIAPTTSVPSPSPLPTATEPALVDAIPTQIPITLSLEERRQLFEDVWATVADNYLYADFRGTNWQALHDVYVPQIEAATTKETFYQTLVELVAQLDDHHSRFVPPSDALAEDANTSGREVTVGIGVVTRLRHDGAFIQMVFPDSPAERAGIRPRDRIIGVDGRPYRTEDGDLLGSDGTAVRLTVVRPGERPRDVVLVRQEVSNRILPYYRRFPGDIGYVAIPTLWANDMGEQVSGALTDLRASGPLRGMVIDLRANRGGWGEVLNEVLSHFVRGQVGVFYGRNHVRPLVIAAPAGPDLRQVPLMVLIDNDTASYAEVMAAILQTEARATVIGARSAGNTETIYAHSFQDGSRLWLAEEGFHLQNGTNLEGIGVLPNVSIESDWTRYSEDDDPQLLEALRLLGGGPK